MKFPKDAIYVDTETSTISENEEEHTPSLILGVAEYVHYDSRCQPTSLDTYYFKQASSFWEWVFDILKDIDELYLYAHNWSFDWQVLQGFRTMSYWGCRIKGIVDMSPPVIIKYTLGKKKINVIDTLNYFRQSLATMGDAAGIPKMEIDFDHCNTLELSEYCRNDVDIIRVCMTSLIQFLYTNDLSRLTDTVASLALAVYTRKFMPCDIFIDGDEDRVAITRQSYFGGRTECFRIGEYEGDFYLIDVNSMYPFVMAYHDYPVRTINVGKNVTVEELDNAIRQYCVTAVCRIHTDIPAFPVKIDGRTCFPVGEYVTTLSTPEVAYALAHDLIEEVHTVAVHVKARIFYDYVSYFYKKRLEYKQSGNEMYQEFCKKLLNSLYGKFGQRGDNWKESDRNPRGLPGRYSELDLDTGKTRRFLEIDNVVFESMGESEARDSYPAIAAHVTAYGRMLLQMTIDHVGREHCYYCDTDSLLLDAMGYAKVEDKLSQSVLGCWSLDGRYDKIDIRGPKDYTFGDKTRIKGIKAKHVIMPDGRYKQLQFRTLRGALNNGDMDTTSIKHVYKRLQREYKKGYVDDFGTVTPLEVEITPEES